MGDLRKSCIYEVSLLEWGQFQQRKRKKKTGCKRESDNGGGAVPREREGITRNQPTGQHCLFGEKGKGSKGRLPRN